MGLHGHREMSAGQPEWDSQTKTGRTGNAGGGQAEQDRQDRTVRTGQSEKDSQESQQGTGSAPGTKMGQADRQVEQAGTVEQDYHTGQVRAA
jgi:hypothetical protein